MRRRLYPFGPAIFFVVLATVFLALIVICFGSLKAFAGSAGTGGGVAVTGTVTTGNCAKFSGGNTIADAGAGCGGGGSVPNGNAPQVVGYASANTGEAETVGGDCTFARASAGNYTITCTKTNGSAFGTAATTNTGTSGATIPLLNGANTWSGVQTFNNADLSMAGSTSGNTLLEATAAAGTNTVATFPANTGTVAELNLAQTYTGANTFNAVETFNNNDIVLGGSSTGTTTFSSANSGASNFTLTFPAITDTLVTLTATQTLTNKSIAASEINSGTLATANGGTGVASPAAHSLLQAEGSSAFGTIAAATAGNLVIDQGSGVDWASKAVSGDTTLASSGSMNVLGLHFGASNGVSLPTTAPTSGGIPYFSSATAIASSAALTANKPVIGGGAGTAPTVGTVSGNTTEFATATGTLTSGDCVKFDGNGNVVDSGNVCNKFAPAMAAAVAMKFYGGL